MTIAEEMLAAYADGELDGEARAAVERAMAEDPQIAHRVERYRSLRRTLRDAYDPVLEEPVPERLITAARTVSADARPSNVIALRGAPTVRARRWSVREWTAIAASLIVGALVSALILRTSRTALLTSGDGQLIARGALASALTTQLASHRTTDAAVAIGVTFVARSGNYCRTFTLRGSSALAGLACRDGGQWRIEVLARSESASAPGGTYRQAASTIPQAVLETASSEMSGEPLDARAEAAARAAGWPRRSQP